MITDTNKVIQTMSLKLDDNTNDKEQKLGKETRIWTGEKRNMNMK